MHASFKAWQCFVHDGQQHGTFLLKQVPGHDQVSNSLTQNRKISQILDERQVKRLPETLRLLRESKTKKIRLRITLQHLTSHCAYKGFSILGETDSRAAYCFIRLCRYVITGTVGLGIIFHHLPQQNWCKLTKKKKYFTSFGQPTRLITCANHGFKSYVHEV